MTDQEPRLPNPGSLKPNRIPGGRDRTGTTRRHFHVLLLNLGLRLRRGDPARLFVHTRIGGGEHGGGATALRGERDHEGRVEPVAIIQVGTSTTS